MSAGGHGDCQARELPMKTDRPDWSPWSLLPLNLPVPLLTSAPLGFTSPSHVDSKAGRCLTELRGAGHHGPRAGKSHRPQPELAGLKGCDPTPEFLRPKGRALQLWVTLGRTGFARKGPLCWLQRRWESVEVCVMGEMAPLPGGPKEVDTLLYLPQSLPPPFHSLCLAVSLLAQS